MVISNNKIECNESDTQEVIGEIQKVKSKKTVKQNEK